MLALCIAATLASAPAPEADAWKDNPHFRRGAAAYDAQRWGEAADAFALAESQEHRPELLWAWAQSLRFGRRCAAAIEVYTRYLETDPPELMRNEARENIRICGGDPDAPPPEPTPTVVTPPPPTVEVISPPRDATVRARPPARDPWGHALTWPGVAIAGIGAGLLGDAHARDRRADRADDEAAYRDAIDGAPTRSRVGVAMLGVGAALVTAGIVRFVIVGARARRAERWSSRTAGAR